MNAREFLEAQNPQPATQPATAEDMAAQKAAYHSGTIQLSFWNNEYEFQNENDEPVNGTVTSYTHRAKLTIRAMERARDEGKRYIEKSGMDRWSLDKVTDKDIETAKSNMRRYGAEI